MAGGMRRDEDTKGDQPPQGRTETASGNGTEAGTGGIATDGQPAATGKHRVGDPAETGGSRQVGPESHRRGADAIDTNKDTPRLHPHPI